SFQKQNRRPPRLPSVRPTSGPAVDNICEEGGRSLEMEGQIESKVNAVAQCRRGGWHRHRAPLPLGRLTRDARISRELRANCHKETGQQGRNRKFLRRLGTRPRGTIVVIYPIIYIETFVLPPGLT